MSFFKKPKADDAVAATPGKVTEKKQESQSMKKAAGVAPAKIVVKERAVEDEEMPVQAESRKHRRQSNAILSDDEDGDDKTAPAPAPASAPEAANATVAAAPAEQAEESAPAAKKAKPAKGADPAAEWAQWKEGESVPYSFVAKAFEDAGNTTKRLEITSIMERMFRAVLVNKPDELLPVVYLTINKVAPDFDNIELGIGESILKKAICEGCGRNMKTIGEMMEEHGDLGMVAELSRAKQKTMFKPKKLQAKKVFSDFAKIAAISGSKSGDQKKGIIQKLLVAAEGHEARFIINGLLGKLRIGLAESTVLTALAQAALLSGPSGQEARGIRNTEKLKAEMLKASDCVKMAFSELPSFDRLVPALLTDDVRNVLAHCHLIAGIPTKPMLAKPTKGITEVLDRFADEDFVCEYKYDGERAQVHMTEDGKISIYSRNLENNTGKYPDIIDFMPKCTAPGVTSFVIDSEAVAFNRETRKILPFQTLQNRSRKGVKLEDVTIHVCLFAFDILYLNGEPLLRKTLRERREALYKSFVPTDGMLTFTTSATRADMGGVEEIQAFLDDAVNNNTEGLMVKIMDDQATYEPSKRSLNWLKIKKDYVDGLTDSFDLVPIAGYYGKGKRTGTYGAYLLACYDEESESYQAITKIGTGFSDEMLQTHAKFFDQHKLNAAPSYYAVDESAAKQPDVWFDACQVWEVMAADLSISPVYQAGVGKVHASKGIALRFPRFLRIRDDKKPEDATNSTQVADMYNNQNFNSNAAEGGNDNVCDDFDI